VTVVMPAHEEEQVIVDALEALLDAPPADLDVIVVPNGCRDRTAARAADVSERVRVVEIEPARKIAALNTGVDLVEHYPVAFVDADVTVSGRDLVVLAERLSADAAAHVASPRLSVRPSRSWLVRQYYRVWALTDYRSSGHIGSGVYMLTEQGLRRFDRFPDVIADDLFVQRHFAPHERLTPDDIRFEVSAPNSLAALTARNARIAAGNRQLAVLRPDLAGAQEASRGAASLVRRVWWRPHLWPGFVVYSAVYLTAHRRAKRMLRERHISWNRDDTTRGRAE